MISKEFRGEMIFMPNNNDNSSEDDINLFRNAMSDVQEMSPSGPDPYRKKHKPVPLELSDGSSEEDEYADLAIETGDFLEFRRSGIQHRVFQDLQRGLIEPEHSLDLHGMRVVEARPAFARFLKQAISRGQRCVRIIHGKGRGSEGQQPVLKQKTNQWLRQNDAVLAFCTAPRWDGGTGAVYVLLSRKYRTDP